MNQELNSLALALADSAIRNTATIVFDQISTAKANKDKDKTIAGLEQIITNLLGDKNELVRIAQALENELISQKITEKDIKYITDNLLPVFEQFTPKGKTDAEQMKKLLSVETLTIMQLIGFNYKKAIGEPLTILLRKYIESQFPTDPLANQKLAITMANLALDQEAYNRFLLLTGQQTKKSATESKTTELQETP